MYCSVSIVYYLKLPVGADAAPLSSLELDIVIRVVNCYDRSDFGKWCQFPKLLFYPCLTSCLSVIVGRVVNVRTPIVCPMGTLPNPQRLFLNCVMIQCEVER